jgi:hypothetical protein
MAIAFITFVCTFGCALGATFIRDRLPPPHLSKESQDVVRLGIGLVATMTALLLGLVTASARSTFDMQDTAIKNSAAIILTLDRDLARYGPDTKPTRDLIQQALAFRIQAIWPDNGPGSAGPEAPSTVPPIEEIENQILRLTPETDTQRWLKSEALKLSQEVVKTRWRVLEAAGGTIPVPFLIAVIFWLTVTFTSFGLYAPRNATVMSVLFVAALSVSAAVFLLLELDGPFDGIVKVSSGPLRFALEHLNQ